MELTNSFPGEVFVLSTGDDELAAGKGEAGRLGWNERPQDRRCESCWIIFCSFNIRSKCFEIEANAEVERAHNILEGNCQPGPGSRSKKISLFVTLHVTYTTQNKSRISNGVYIKYIDERERRNEGATVEVEDRRRR